MKFLMLVITLGLPSYLFSSDAESSSTVPTHMIEAFSQTTDSALATDIQPYAQYYSPDDVYIGNIFRTCKELKQLALNHNQAEFDKIFKASIQDPLFCDIAVKQAKRLEEAQNSLGN